MGVSNAGGAAPAPEYWNNGAMSSFWGAHNERVEREPITGVWGRAPSGVQGQSARVPGQGSGDEAP